MIGEEPFLVLGAFPELYARLAAALGAAPTCFSAIRPRFWLSMLSLLLIDVELR